MGVELTAPRRRDVLSLAAAAAAVPLRTGAQTPALRLGSSTSGEGYYEAHYAAALGFFKNAGLNVDVVPLPNGQIVAAASGRAIDVGFTDPVVIANAVNRGLPWTVIGGGAAYVDDAPTTLLCTAKDGPVHRPRDLAGRAIGVLILESLSTLGVTDWLDANGVDPGSVRFYQLPYASMLPALVRGDIGAAFIGEPVLSSVKSELRVFARAFSALAKTFYLSCCFTTREWLASNLDLAKRLVAALDATGRFANAHHDETAPVLAAGTHVPVDVIRNVTRARYAALDPRLLQPVFDAAYKFKATAKPLVATAVIADAVDPR